MSVQAAFAQCRAEKGRCICEEVIAELDNALTEREIEQLYHEHGGEES